MASGSMYFDNAMSRPEIVFAVAALSRYMVARRATLRSFPGHRRIEWIGTDRTAGKRLVGGNASHSGVAEHVGMLADQVLEALRQPGFGDLVDGFGAQVVTGAALFEDATSSRTGSSPRPAATAPRHQQYGAGLPGRRRKLANGLHGHAPGDT